MRYSGEEISSKWRVCDEDLDGGSIAPTPWSGLPRELLLGNVLKICFAVLVSALAMLDTHT